MSIPERNDRPGLWWVGDGGMVAQAHVIAAGRWESAPIRRAARRARAENRLIDLTYGRACYWVVFLDNGQVVLATDLPAADMHGQDEFDLNRSKLLNGEG